MLRLYLLVFLIFTSLSNANERPSHTGNWYQPPILTTWHWQLDGKISSHYPVDMYDIDLFNIDSKFIKKMQKKGKKIICYFSAGSIENWRTDASQFNSKDIGNSLDQWPGERWLNIRSPSVHSIIIKRLDLAANKGCDGVEPDNMDAYSNNSGFDLSFSDQLFFNRLIANEAHNRNLSIGLKNDLDQVKELVDYYDFAVNEQCFEYSECGQLLPFINKGKAVFNAEYQSELVHNKKARIKLCKQSFEKKFHTLILPLDLDDSFRIGCLDTLKNN